MPVRQSLEVFQSCNLVNTFRNGVECLIGFPEFLYTRTEGNWPELCYSLFPQGINSTFKFHLSDTSVPFNVSTKSSVGFIQVTGPLDRETEDSYTLHVRG